MNSANTIRKALLDFTVDKKSSQQIEGLIKQLAELERASQRASKQLNSHIRNLQDSKNTGVLSDTAKNEVYTQRKILQQAQGTARTLIDQIALEAGKGMNREQKAQFARAMNEAFGEITGRFVQQSKKQAKAEAKKLTDFYNDELRKNPTVSKARRPTLSQINSQSAVQLEKTLAQQKVYQTAANRALNYGIANGDRRLEANASKALRSLEESTKAATVRLKELNDEARKAARAAEKQAKASTKAASPVLTAEQKRVNRKLESIQQQRVNNQVDGGAQQFRNQAQLLRNYTLMGGGVAAAYGSASFSIDLDRQFKQLQSIVALTNDEMEILSKNLIDVSEKTKFTATDVADAAIVLGQAGLGMTDIQNAVEGVTLFATAVGSDLKSAVDIATSTLGVFNKDSSQMVDVVDKMTTAVNSSKLNLDKLTLGLQYAGNLAAQSNITFEETVSALGAMANSGIKAGSTLGTGLRQIIIALQKPSDSFRKTIHGLGLSMEDLDISTHGLVPVLRRLSEEGFTVRDAMETMQVRAASAYGAFANNIDVAEELNEKMRIGGSATKANATQMEALGNQLDRFGSISKTLVYESLEPLLVTITALVEKSADFLSTLRQLGPLLNMIAVPAAILGGVLSARSVVKLSSGLLGGGAALLQGKGLSGAASALGKASPGIMGAARLVGLSNPYVAGATLAGSLGVASYNLFSSSKRANDRVDSTQADLNRSTSEVGKYDAQLKKVTNTIDTLVLKQFDLADQNALRREIQRLNSEFKQQGLFIDDSVDSYDKLIAKMREFETSTQASTNYLKGRNRNNLVEASDAIVDQLGQSDLLDDKASIIATRGFSYKSGRNNQTRFQSDLAYNSFKVLSQVLPNVADDLKNTITGIENINPREDGARGRADNVAKQLEVLAREMMGVVNGSAEQRDQVLEGAGLYSQEERKKTLDGITEIANVLFGRANRVQQVGLNLKTFENNDASLLEAETQLRNDFRSKYVGKLQDNYAVVGQEIASLKAPNQEYDTSQFVDTYIKMESLFTDQLSKMSEVEAEAIAELSKIVADDNTDENLRQIIGNPKQYLAKIGFYESMGSTESKLRRQLETSATYAGPDAKLYFDSKIETLDQELNDLEASLRQDTDEARSNKIVEKLNALRIQREELATQQDTFTSRVNGQTPISVRERESTQAARIAASEANYARIQEQVLTRQRISQNLNDRQSLPFSRQKIQDDELVKLLSDFMASQTASIQNEQTQSNLGAERVRQIAEDFERRASDALAVASNSGFSRDVRETAAEQAQGYTDNAQTLRAQALKIETESARIALEAFKELRDYLQTEIVDQAGLAQGRAKTRAETSVTGLDGTITGLQSDIQNLNVDAQNLKIDGRDQTDNIQNVRRGVRNSEYLNSSYQRQTAAIYGGVYTPQGSTEQDETYAGLSGNSLGDIFSNIGNDIGTQTAQAYEGFDGLTSLTLGLQDAARGLGDTFGETFNNIIQDSDNAGSYLKNMLSGLLSDVSAMASRALTNQIVSSIFGTFFGGATGVSAGGNSSSFAGYAYTGKHIIAGNYYSGGEVTGGMSSRDSTFAKVAKGEFVLRKKAVDAIGLENLRALNAADPGTVRSGEAMASGSSLSKSDSGSGGGGTVNVWVVPKDEVPQSTGPNDVVHYVGDNMTRNGVLKTLVKSIVMETIGK